MIIGDNRSRKRAEMMIDEVFRHKKEIFSLENVIHEVQDQIKQEKQKLDGAFKVSFEVDSRLIRYVIGKKGENIQKAEKMKGVRQVKIEEFQDNPNARITVLAEDEDIAEDAKEILEIVEDRCVIPKGGRLMSRLIGKSGVNIKEIIKKSEVILIRSLQRERRENNEADDGPEKLIIIGTKETVGMAKMLLEQQIKNFTEFDTLETQKQDLRDDLRDLQPRRNRPQGDRRIPGDTGDRDRDGGGRGRGRNRGGNRRSNRGGGNQQRSNRSNKDGGGNRNSNRGNRQGNRGKGQASKD